jgi:putative hydrolase
MKIWKKYADLLLKGEWHIHTNYTDGENSVYEYCEKAVEKNIPLIAFTEHVRKNLTYDFNKFLEDIEDSRGEFDVIILSGCEVKVLSDGNLDVNDWILKEIDYPIFAFHSFPDNINLYLKGLKGILKNKYLNTWAHPGTFLTKFDKNLYNSELTEIFKLMKRYNVLFEMNKKYDFPLIDHIIKEYNFCTVNGNDIHSINDLE